MITTPRVQRRLFIYSYLFKKLGILSEQEFNKITNIDQLHVQR
jgi:hypothetical protein